MIFINNTDLVHSIDSEDISAASDHKLLTVQVTYNNFSDRIQLTVKTEPTIGDSFNKLNFMKADWKLLNDEISSLDWSFLAESSPEEGLQFFYERLLAACEKIVPAKKMKRDNKPKPMSSHRQSRWKRLNKQRKRLQTATTAVKVAAIPVSYTHLTLPTKA